jgi:hypothetical protein
MERQRTIGLGALFLIVVAVAAFWSRIPHTPAPEAAAPSASATTSATATPAPAPTPSALTALEAAVETALSPEEGLGESFDVLPDGRKAPPVPDSAPQQVTFGVVVFAYQGSQFAPPNARTKDQAKQKALAVAADAQHDFAAAVAKGDHGSTSNAGRMPRGILEGAAEYILFSLGKGQVASEPVDTPRGYWILRRID